MNEWLTDPTWRFKSGRGIQGPDPIGAQRIKTLKLLREADRPWSQAEAQFGALYRMGYIRRVEGRAQITNAGLAVLERAEKA